MNYKLNEITVPTLVIHAIDDSNVPFTHAENVIRKKIQGAKLLSLPNGGHLKLKHFDTIREEVTRFINSNKKN